MTRKDAECPECGPHLMMFHNDKGCRIEMCPCTIARSIAPPALDFPMDQAA